MMYVIPTLVLPFHLPLFFFSRDSSRTTSTENANTELLKVGTGPGNVTEILTKRFSNVRASDSSKLHLDVAKNWLNNPSVTFLQCRAEELVDVVESHDHDQADLVTAAECIMLMNPEQSVTGFAKLLRPGGTVAIWAYGRPIFPNDETQGLYDKISAKAWERVFPSKALEMENAVKTMKSWLDVVAFPPETWTDVKRIKRNNDRPLNLVSDEHFDHEIKYQSGVGPGDKVEEQVDRNFWMKEGCGIDWVKGFIDVQYPWKTTDDEISEQLKPMYEELEVSMGGKGSTVKIAWPVVLLLATKR
jgi:ubiquinone/menaquinone biosynthesis C-methylase UbiE